MFECFTSSVVNTCRVPDGFTAGGGNVHWQSTQYTVAVCLCESQLRTLGATAETNDVPSVGDDIVTQAWPRNTGTSSPVWAVPRLSMMNFGDVELIANVLSTLRVVCPMWCSHS